jgi:hypothetical protein
VSVILAKERRPAERPFFTFPVVVVEFVVDALRATAKEITSGGLKAGYSLR